MADREEDGNVRRKLSTESSGIYVEESQSIHSLSSLSDSSLELPPQAGSVRIQKKSQKGIQSTPMHHGERGEDEDDMSQDSSHFSLGLDLSKGLHGAYRGSRSYHSTISQESSVQDDGQSESSMTDHLEIAALIAKAKRQISEVRGTPYENDHRKSKEMSDSADSPVGNSSVHQKIPSKSTIISPSPEKNNTAEKEKRKSSTKIIPQETTPMADHVQKVSAANVDHNEQDVRRSHKDTLSQRFSRNSILSEQDSLENEEFVVENLEEDRESLGSHQKSSHPSVIEPTQKSPVTTREEKQKDSQSADGGRQSYDSHREEEHTLALVKEGKQPDNSISSTGRKLPKMQKHLQHDQITAQLRESVSRNDSVSIGRRPTNMEKYLQSNRSISHTKEGAPLHSSVSSGHKSTNIQKYLHSAPSSGSDKDHRKGTKQGVNSKLEQRKKLLQRVSSHPQKGQQKLQGRFTWERDWTSSRTRNEEAQGDQVHTWNYEKAGKRLNSTAALGKGREPKVPSVETIERGYRTKVPSEETRAENPVQTEKLFISKVLSESYKALSSNAEKKEDFSPERYPSTRMERRDEGEGSSRLNTPKVDCRTISEKLKDSVYSGRQDKADSRTSYQSPRQLESRSAPKRENDAMLRNEYRLESREDSFDGDRLLYVDHNRRTEMSSLSFKCRALTEKERFMRLYQEKEKVANEFITKWAQLSETPASGNYMRHNRRNAYQIHNNYAEPWGRANEGPPWSRISSLTQHDFPHTSTMPMKSTGHPNVHERQLGSKKKRWVCDICAMANFESYAACFIHEKNCTGPARKASVDYPPTREGRWLPNE